jgi:NAD(P)-dependent dehydrogenase (short-subunit alcohol dehydrogenase family)
MTNPDDQSMNPQTGCKNPEIAMDASYKPAEDLLDERVILVTGAGDGIGRMAAKTFAAHGATVVLLGKTVAKLESVYDEIEAAGGPEPAIYPMHLEGAAPHDYDELAHVIDMNFGRLDGLLHNAARLPYLSRIKDHDATDWVKVLQSNLTAPFLLTQACLPLLLAAADGRLLFTTDEAGQNGKAFWGAYAVSKAGIERLGEILAAELANSSVRVNCIDPGPTLTSLRKVAFPGEDKTTLKTPDALRNLYLWAMGPDSADTHGQRLAYDARP